MEIKVIPMEAHHVDSAYEVEISCFPNDPWLKEWLTAEFEGSVNHHHVACVDGAVAGYICLYFNDFDGGYLKIGNIAVSPKFRRQGIGMALMEKVMEIAADIGTRGVKLEVDAGNTAAKALYDKFGFVVEDIIKEYYDDGSDALVMWKR
jgi:ribosomal-protein-alanine N-acetyltransferase